MTDPIESAQTRLDKAAIVIGSCLLDAVDPDWDSQVELEAACIAYVKALRTAPAVEKQP